MLVGIAGAASVTAALNHLGKQFARALKVFTFARSHYPNGKYAQIACDWEGETRRMLGEKTGVKSLDDDDDDDDEDEDVLGGVAHAEDDAAPRPKRRSQTMAAKSEEKRRRADLKQRQK